MNCYQFLFQSDKILTSFLLIYSHSYYQTTKKKKKKIQFQSLPEQDFENTEATVHFIKVFKNWSL